jgi:iron complex outermembrane receptor protein
VGVWILAIAAAAAAQSVPPAGEDPSAIIVTGERVKRSLKDTPSSVAVFDRRDLDRMAAPDRMQNLLAMVPNVLVPTSRDAPTIRGQNSVGVLQALPAFLGGARPRTTLQIDGRTVTFNEFVNSPEGLWDVDHVEVFRTPQTTTQGANSIAGAIFIHTAEPTYVFEGRARLVSGQFRRRQASAAVSGPIGDQVAFRIAGDFYRSRTSTTMHGPVVGIDNLNLDRYWAGRAKLLFEPRGAPGLNVLTTYAHTRAQAPQGESARPPFRERRDDFYPFGYFKSQVDSITSLISYPLGEALESRTTLSWGKSHFRRFAPQGFGQTQIHGRDVSAESVLEWKPARALSAVGGASFQRVKLDQFINLAVTGLGTGSFNDRQTSAGLFGELNWRPAERLSLVVGGRYQSDGKTRTGVLTMTPPLPLAYDKTSHALLPKLSAAYDLTDDLRIGVLAQRAYNPGGVTLDPKHRAQLEFKPEYLWDYEVFTRASLWGGGVELTGNIFYSAIRDAQREFDFDLSSPGGNVGLLQIFSEPRARIYGAELELNAKPSRRLTARVAVGLLNTRITRTVDPKDPFLGKEFAGAPHFTGSASADWQPLDKVHISAQVRHNSGYWGEDSEDPQFRTTPWTMVDARASWDARRVTVFAYAQNLFDTFHVIGWAGPRDDPDVEVELADPREIGVGLEARF